MHERAPVATRERCGDVVGVGGRGRSEHLGVDVGAAGLGVLELLEHERRAALGDDEAVATASKGRDHPLVESAVMLPKATPIAELGSASSPPRRRR
jgi:hypothetical protein